MTYLSRWRAPAHVSAGFVPLRVRERAAHDRLFGGFRRPRFDPDAGIEMPRAVRGARRREQRERLTGLPCAGATTFRPYWVGDLFFQPMPASFAAGTFFDDTFFSALWIDDESLEQCPFFDFEPRARRRELRSRLEEWLEQGAGRVLAGREPIAAS